VSGFAEHLLDQLDLQKGVKERRTWRGGDDDEIAKAADARRTRHLADDRPVEVRKASAPHPAGQDKAPPPKVRIDDLLMEVGGDYYQTLSAAHQKLLRAFRDAEHRDPTADDDAYWEAYRRIVDALARQRQGERRMTDAPLHAELAELQADEGAARERSEDLAARVRGEWRTSEALLKPWWSRRDRSPTTEELREWTADPIAQVTERGLALALDSPGHRALAVVDPALRDEAADARKRYAAARQRRIAFERAHADGLKFERAKAEAERLRDTLAESDDPDEIRRALAGAEPESEEPQRKPIAGIPVRAPAPDRRKVPRQMAYATKGR
jgi:hypothetical protein